MFGSRPRPLAAAGALLALVALQSCAGSRAAATNPPSADGGGVRVRPRGGTGSAMADTTLRSGAIVYDTEELPEVITKVQPVYPERAAADRIEGVVMVQALVLKDGTVGDTKVVKSIPELDDAAVAAVRQWRFKPGKVQGSPVDTWVAVPIKFPPQPDR